VINTDKPHRKSFFIPHASRDPHILADQNLMNEYIFNLNGNPPETGVIQDIENLEKWNMSSGSAKASTTQGVAIIKLKSGPLLLDGAKWHLLKQILDEDTDTNPLGQTIQHKLTRQMSLDKNELHRSYS